MISVILLLAGSGTRMNLEMNKVFLHIANQPIFMHSYQKFLEQEMEIVFVIRKEDEELLKSYLPDAKYTFGGSSRQESVFLGLQMVTGTYTLIHDAARPFINKRIIKDCVKGLEEGKAVLTAVQAKDTMYLKGNKLDLLNRELLYHAQTPQGFRTEELLKVHQKAVKDNWITTDDISLLKHYGYENIEVVLGDYSNIKITTTVDYIMAKELAK